MMAHKPGSRKGQVHDVFDKQGAEAAVKLGDKLGLAAGTVRSWMNTWAKSKGVALPKAAKSANEPAAPRKRRAFIDPTKRRVYDISIGPKHLGTVIEEGAQVSTVRWDDGHPWHPSHNLEHHVQNKFLKDAKVETGKK